ncbi:MULTISPECIES: ABC transporter permease [unclassified Francisella]|uniref:ABC transporter permease n=1 Tax=unclassified Francisella TaxID=2610885 RepID=UPI002E310807|nr:MULTISPECIES: ABC transporter permease [unclassified Francisella]MED7819503.1 ABC transporter permease [Francisella sp. 19S2-4]MED7830292.1 ABC transporter permease [Francisella sp. 19S2-10]
MKQWLLSIYLYRGFVISSIKRELSAAFARSKLGGLWTIINPLAQVLIYALILSNVLAAKLPNIDNKYAYAIYLMAGTLAWNLNNELISRGLNIFTSNAGVLQKMNFPKIVLPCIAVGSAVINNILLFLAVTIIFFLLGHGFNLTIFWLVPLTFVVVLLGIGLGMIVGVINVFLRDIGQFIPIVLQVWFWFTPIVYPETIIPEKYRGLLSLNPMYSIVDAYHNVLVYGIRPHLFSLLYITLFSLLLLAFALFLFKRSSAEMVDVL